MLQHIKLVNFILIDKLELDIASGMTVITGETGAGKSIIIDAIELALGNRLDSHVIGHYNDRCEINLIFDMSQNKPALQWLIEHDLDNKQECIIRRVIRKQGRSRCYINDATVSQQSLAEIGELLINIHGQHEQQRLLKQDQQRHILDEYAQHTELCAEVLSLYQRWQQCEAKIAKLSAINKDQQSRREFLRFQLDELEQLGISENELSQLNEEHKQLAHADDLQYNINSSLGYLSSYEIEKPSIIDLLNLVLTSLTKYREFNAHLKTCYDLLQSGLVQIEEATTELRHYQDKIEQNPERLAFVEQRLAAIHDLAHKHRITPDKLLSLQADLENELLLLDNCDEDIKNLQQQLAVLEKNYFKQAKQLSQQRQRAALHLAKAVTDNMQQLGMEGGEFKIALNEITPQKMTAFGLERIAFYVSANPGQALQPLQKVISGGELSRISLALQVIIANTVTTPCLIFDEVDVGIGGKIAAIVGRMLQRLAQSAQILCITHLPQVAAHGQQHWQVTKQTINKLTKTEIHILSAQEKIDEIARMLGGIEITKQTRAHAEEMIATETTMVF